MVATFVQVNDDCPDLVVDYNSECDVLRVVAGRFDNTEGLGIAEGIELDFDMFSDTPSGATVIGCRRNKWDHNIDELARILAEHTSIDRQILVAKIAGIAEVDDNQPNADQSETK